MAILIQMPQTPGLYLHSKGSLGTLKVCNFLHFLFTYLAKNVRKYIRDLSNLNIRNILKLTIRNPTKSCMKESLLMLSGQSGFGDQDTLK